LRIDEKDTKDTKLIATIRFYNALIEDKDGNIITHIPLLGPIAVLPEYKHQGYGKALIKYALNILQDKQEKATILIGDLARYQHYGFTLLEPNLSFSHEVKPLELLGLSWQEGFFNDMQATVRLAEI
jgi:predicted N-acetyltransferase YhbS